MACGLFVVAITNCSESSLLICQSIGQLPGYRKIKGKSINVKNVIIVRSAGLAAAGPDLPDPA